MAHILKQKKRIIHLVEELKEKWNVSRCGLKSKKRRTQIALPIVQTEYTFLGFREVCLLHNIYFKRGPLFLLFSSFHNDTVDSKEMFYKNLPVSGFEPRTSSIGSNRSAN